MRWYVRFWFLVFWLALAAAALPSLAASPASTNVPGQPNPTTKPPDPGHFTGSRSCRECHQHFYSLWSTSHHGLAMQSYAIARTNLTAQPAPLQVGTNSYRADVQAGVVIEKSKAGEKRFPIEQAMGGKNVLYFLTPWLRGRLQVLPIAYDLRRREWFDVARSAVRHFGSQPDEPLYWTDSVYTFNTACFNCHVSQLTNNFNLQADRYQTAWAEPGINCETCHGPASGHLRIANETPEGQPLKHLGLISNRTFNSDQANSTCATCHAKMVPITAAFTPGDLYFDHFGLATLEDNDFYPDGRDLGENFTFTTWRLNPCQMAGKLNCVTCHTSSGRFRFADAPNQSCLPCHEKNVQNLAAHSHHQPAAGAPTCISCHMPMTEFARMRRSDHSLRPPMPAATLAFGSPNACNLCHTNKSPAWADAQVRQWHPDDYQRPVLEVASLVAAARKHDWSKLPQINQYLSNAARGEIWATGLIRLLGPCDLEAKWTGIKACLTDRSPLVRAAAAEALGNGLRREFIPLLTPLVKDPSRLVRVRTANALSAVPDAEIPVSDRKALQAAAGELLASFQARPDDSASYHNLGNFQLARRQYPEAINAFRTAARLQPSDPAPLVNLSLAYNLNQENEKAEASLRQALRLAPTNAAVHLNLAMLLAEMNRLPEAEQSFRAAFRADPKSAQAAFNLGVLLAKDKPEESLTWSRRAAELEPAEPKYAYTLAFFQYQQGIPAEAIRTLEALTASAPGYTDAYALLERVYEERKDLDKALATCRRAITNSALPESDRKHFEALARQLSP